MKQKQLQPRRSYEPPEGSVAQGHEDSSPCSETSSEEYDQVLPSSDEMLAEVSLDGDFRLPCGLYQAQVLELMHRNLTPEDFDMLKVLDDSIPNANTMSSDLMQRLTRVKVKASEDCECGVCLSRIGPEAEAIKLPCKHIFHHRCIEKWLTQCKNSCPMCSAAINPDTFG
eukprot:CAMPEP_0197629792 /NCGR_PEP_ID=MMETSP1338-20131121/7509_1 /TAXON_ID=43686 ORGANISM="Pelagodinium beii, Strain RCC1491" /NCGR_SAMPLE_ID=MMETSP1338 /ASSEMBLY_ACC=CAM_ASM_000754 /LENGTH=169 /DNA_ID=CAMNT_0043200891 /DNA_START=139 /DNA_END=648 /DNA_ORIENTATION=-